MSEQETVIENKVDNGQEITSQEQSKPVESTPVQSQESPETINWRKFREQRETERKEKEAAEKIARQKQAEAEALKAAMDALLQKPSHQSNDSSDESEDDRIQKKVEAALRAQQLKADAERAERDRRDLPVVLKKTYADFDQVCSSENLDYLEYHYPEVVEGFKHMPESFDKWSAIYRATKKFIPNTNVKQTEARIEKNTLKPQSMSVAGVTSTGDHAPSSVDDARKAANWQRMQRIMRGG